MRLPETLKTLVRRPALRAATASAVLHAQSGGGRLAELEWTGPNLGNLRALHYAPSDIAPGAPLVVVLHGCTQNASAYDVGAGWSQLADRQGFALLFPEQQRANNPNLCFNWFQGGDTKRGAGEAGSIREMVRAMVAAHALDPARIFVTGLSAGGAMTGALLAAYPELFAAGAIVAGIPFGAASGVPQAFEAMSGGEAGAQPRELGDRVRAASRYAGRWPRVQIWHGTADHTVAPANGDSIARQWINVHGLGERDAADDCVDGQRRRRWTGSDGCVQVEQIWVAGLGHGTPLKPGTGPGQAGAAGPHMIDAGISSTHRIAEFFGIAPPSEHAAEAMPSTEQGGSTAAESASGGVEQVIEDALRSAGLLR